MIKIKPVISSLLVFISVKTCNLILIKSLNNEGQIIHEKVISNELNNHKDYDDSQKIIQNGTETIIAFRRKAQDSNEVLSDYNILSSNIKKVILVKEMIPDAQGLIPSIPKHFYGRPRIRGSETINPVLPEWNPGIRFLPPRLENRLNPNNGDQSPIPEPDRHFIKNAYD
jgi:predicted RND superfamily exporter protein